MAVGTPPGGVPQPSGDATSAVTAATADLATAAAAVEAGDYAAAADAYTAAAVAAAAAAAAAATAAAHAHNAVGREGGGDRSGGAGGGAGAYASAVAAARSALALVDATTGLAGRSGSGGGVNSGGDIGGGGPMGAASTVNGSRHAAHYEHGVALLGEGRPSAAAGAFRRAGAAAPSPSLRADYAGWADRAEAAAAGATAAPASAPAAAPAAATTDGPAAGRATSAEAGNTTGEAAADAASESVALAGPPPPRYAAYQSATHVTIDVYVKGVDRAASKVTFGETTLGVTLVKRDGTPGGGLELVLGGVVVPATATWSATAVKVEVRLAKATAGTAWPADRIAMPAAVAASAAATPSSSAAAASAAVAAAEAKRRAWEASAAAQLGEEDEMGGDPMALFRKLYDGGDDDARRAMVKSYSESNGQVLSMNWEEVAKKKVTYEEKD